MIVQISSPSGSSIGRPGSGNDSPERCGPAGSVSISFIFTAKVTLTKFKNSHPIHAP